MPLTLYRRPGSDAWHYRGTVGRPGQRQRLRGSARTSDKAQAQQIASSIEERYWKSSLDGPASVLTFGDAAAIYLAAGKPHRFIERIVRYWKKTLIREITAGAIKQAATTLHPQAKGTTRNRQVIVPTQAIINHAAELGLCPRISVERFPVVRREKEPATWPWVLAFMAQANPHLGALCAFMFLTGARISEALSVTWDDIDLGRCRALIRQGKLGGEERWAHLPAELVVAIANIERKGETVFRYSSRDTAAPQWDKAIKRAKIKPLSFHACRHGFATGLLDRGVNPKTVAKRGGWKSVQHVLDTYAHDVASTTITNLLTDAPLTQAEPAKVIIEKKSTT